MTTISKRSEASAVYRARRGGTFEILNLGGLRIRDTEALKTWMDERQAAGIVGFHTSLAGCDNTHDRWNGRRGDFDYQISILRMAGERGMVRQERLFLTLNTLPLFERLLGIMDGIPGEIRSRIVTPFFYAGLGRRYEDERITEEDFGIRCQNASQVSVAEDFRTGGPRGNGFPY